jgi:glutathione S-transferase
MYTLHYAPDNASLIIRFALEELGLPYQTKLVDRSTRAQDSAAYRRISPTGLIPALEVGDQTLFETGAILLWLSETHNALAPAPRDPARADFLKWLFFTANTLHADMRLHFYADRYGGSPKALAEFKAATKTRITAHLDLLNHALAESPHLFMADGPTVLGIYLVTLCRWLQLYPEGEAGWFHLPAYPDMLSLSRQIEIRTAILRAALAEGLGDTPLSNATLAQPPEGSVT